MPVSEFQSARKAPINAVNRQSLKTKTAAEASAGAVVLRQGFANDRWFGSVYSRP